MNRGQKILTLSAIYGVIALGVSVIFNSSFFFEDQVLLERLSVAAIGFAVGLAENGLGLGLFNKWINQE